MTFSTVGQPLNGRTTAHPALNNGGTAHHNHVELRHSRKYKTREPSTHIYSKWIGLPGSGVCVLQFDQTVCTRVLWEAPVVFLLDVVRQITSRQEMLPRETSGALLGCRERYEDLWVYSFRAGLIDGPTWEER